MCTSLCERFKSLEVGSRTVLGDRNMLSVTYKPVVLRDHPAFDRTHMVRVAEREMGHQTESFQLAPGERSAVRLPYNPDLGTVARGQLLEQALRERFETEYAN